MTRARRILGIIGLALKLFIIALAVLLVLAFFGSAAFELIAHSLGGFVFFLMEKLPRISTDRATWLPGIGAFLLATVLADVMLKKAARNRDRDWNFKTTACLSLLLPVLFAISFIVPGLILQVNSLARIRWFDSSSGSTKALVAMQMRSLAQLCHLHATNEATNRYPISLENLSAELYPNKWIHFSSSFGLPVEKPIYLGAGMPIDTDSEEALLISPAFEFRGKWQRVVQKFNGMNEMIPAMDAEAWIDRSLERRRLEIMPDFPLPE